MASFRDNGAALEGAEVQDNVSAALAPSLGFDEESRIFGAELAFGSTIWREKDKYLQSSAVLQADKVVTPFLMLH
jgi:hypothetical protein